MSKSFMKKSFAQTMLKASRLIRRSLLAVTPKAWPQIRTQARPEARREPVPAANDSKVNPSRKDAPPQVIITRPAQPAGDTPTEIPRKASPGLPRREASFTKHRFVFEGDTYPYRLYIPSAPASGVSDSRPMPLLVLLHGCKQDALDFSNGTAMNALAEDHQVMVLYPEQITSANAMRCWNWFEPSHQQAERGEPGMIAALTQKIIQKYDADPKRVYIAGLSAGGAMAAVVSGLHPDIFAAVGVHSGLAAGAARDMVSAFGAMRSGAKGRAAPVIPTIVFHGSADKTVHPDNGEHITDAALAALKASGVKLVKTQSTSGKSNENGEEKTDRVVYSTADGKPYIENWRIDGGPHAWSGGDAAGSYTDPDGPSASAALLAFFLQHRLHRA